MLLPLAPKLEVLDLSGNDAIGGCAKPSTVLESFISLAELRLTGMVLQGESHTGGGKCYHTALSQVSLFV